MKIKRALISVSDKSGLEMLVKVLNEYGIEIISTGNTARMIKNAGYEVKTVSDYTGSAEILGGRVKTLHPKIFGGILATGSENDKVDMLKSDIMPIDMVIVNLYPFEKMCQSDDEKLAIENIDIGGVSLLRAAAKNYERIAVVNSPNQYNDLIAELRKNNGKISTAVRKSLAVDAFAVTAFYDSAILNWFNREKQFPEKRLLRIEKINDLRYGENPHQMACFYKDADFVGPGLSDLEILGGKQLSYNNVAEIDTLWQMVSDHGNENFCVILKHANPCGAAIGCSMTDAYEKALSTDPVSAFGGLVGFNKTIDSTLASELIKRFYEVVAAPDISENALKLLKTKKNLRIVRFPEMLKITENYNFKRVRGGFLVSDFDQSDDRFDSFKVVTKIKPAELLKKDIAFSWRMVKYVKSNAIVYVKDQTLIGVGAGQVSRIDSVKIAAMKAEQSGFDLRGAVMASDGFFPFPDSVEVAADYGISAIVTPGGSIRDQLVVDKADALGIPMIFTGIRHFRH